MQVRKLVATSFAACALVGAGSSAAFAGEVNGNQKPIPAPEHAASECVYSGQNNFNEPTDPGRTQSYGQLVKLGLKAVVPSPGVACNPTRAGSGEPG